METPNPAAPAQQPAAPQQQTLFQQGTVTQAPAQPAAAPAPASPPPVIHLSVEDYQRYRSLETELAEVRKAQQAAIEVKEAERLRALAEKGQIEEALTQQRKSWEQKHAEATARFSQLEQQVLAERKSSVIADAFQGRAFLGETPEQKAATAAMARRLLADDFETVRDAAGNLQVLDKTTRRPAADVLKERLDSPQFAIFFAAQSKGGVPPLQPGQPPATGNVQPGSLDAIVADWNKRQSQYQSFGLRGTPMGRQA